MRSSIVFLVCACGLQDTGALEATALPEKGLEFPPKDEAPAMPVLEHFGAPVVTAEPLVGAPVVTHESLDSLGLVTDALPRCAPWPTCLEALARSGDRAAFPLAEPETELLIFGDDGVVRRGAGPDEASSFVLADLRRNRWVELPLEGEHRSVITEGALVVACSDSSCVVLDFARDEVVLQMSTREPPTFASGGLRFLYTRTLSGGPDSETYLEYPLEARFGETTTLALTGVVTKVHWSDSSETGPTRTPMPDRSLEDLH